MNCEQFHLWMDLGGFEGKEWDAEQKAAVEEHVRDCPACEAVYADRRRFEARVGKAMLGGPVPESSLVQIKQKLKVLTRKRFRRRTLEVCTLAASLFLAVGVGFGWRGKMIPPQDITIPVSNGNPRDAFQAWKESLEYTFNPDAIQFNPDCYTSNGEVEIKSGVTVPSVVLYNQYTHTTATIFVLVQAKIAPSKIEDLIPRDLQSSMVHTRIIRDASYPDDVFYIVSYTGSSFDAFLKHPNDI